MIEAEPRCALEYAAVVDPGTFAPLASLEGPALLAVAARVGPARLIDNVHLPRTTRTSTIQRAPVTDGDLSYAGAPTSRESR